MKINIVIPCYNEQEVLTKTIEVLGKLSGRIKQETGVDTAHPTNPVGRTHGC